MTASDAETGFGLEIGGGLDFTDPARGVMVSLDGRTLALHGDGAFRNWGLGLNLAWDPNPETKRGWSATAGHSLGGASTGGVDALLGPEIFPGLSETDGGESWSLEAAHGMSRGKGMVGSLLRPDERERRDRQPAGGLPDRARRGPSGEHEGERLG